MNSNENEHLRRLSEQIEALKKERDAAREELSKQSALASDYCAKVTQLRGESDYLRTLIKSVEGEREAARVELVQVREARRFWPDLGPDPLKAGREERKRLHIETYDRLMKGCAMQQKEVPDQTQLVWRIDMSRICDELTWRRAAMDGPRGLKAQLREVAEVCLSAAKVLIQNKSDAEYCQLCGCSPGHTADCDMGKMKNLLEEIE